MNHSTRNAPSKAAAQLESTLASSLEATIKRFKMYPPGHPACKTATDKPFNELNAILRDSERVILSIGDGRLIINGIPTALNSSNSMLADAISELRIKSVVFRSDISMSDLISFLQFFSTKTGRADRWGDLNDHIANNGIKNVEIDTLRYELVGDDEKIVSADTQDGPAACGESPVNRMTVDFAKFVKEHPELLFGLFSDKESAGKTVCKEYQAEIDLDRLLSDADREIADLGEDQFLDIIALGLKRMAGTDVKADSVDFEDSLFSIRSMIEKAGNLDVLPRIKRLVEEFRLIDDKYIDLILDGKYSKKRLAFEELEATSALIDSGEADAARLALVPKRLEILDDSNYTHGMLTRLSKNVADSAGDETRFEASRSVLAAIARSAVENSATSTCGALIELIKSELDNSTIQMPYFGFLCRLARLLAEWLLNQESLDELVQLVGAVHRFVSDEVVFADGVRDEADNFILAFGTNLTSRKILHLLKADFEQTRKSAYELFFMLKTQETALSLFEYITVDDTSFRLFMVRILSEYGSLAIRAFQLAIADDAGITSCAADKNIPQETWYRVRNILFVAGNTRTPEAVELVERFDSFSDPRVAAEVVVALEKIGDGKSARVIAGFLDFPDAEVRHKAAIALGNVGTPDTLPYLKDAITDKPEMGSVLIPVIAAVGSEAAVDFLGELLMNRKGVLTEILSRDTEREKLLLVNAISRITSPKAVSRLVEFRKQSLSGLRGIFKSAALTKAVNQAIDRIERKLTTGQNEP